jgi:phage protein U
MASYALLGQAFFEVQGLNYQEVERKFHFRWKEQERIGDRPARQWLGPGEESINLHGFIFPKDPRFAGSLDALNSLRASAASGQFFNFSVMSDPGTARFLGTWCVLAVFDQQKLFANDGTPRKVHFTIEIGAYGGDNLGFFY